MSRASKRKRNPKEILASELEGLYKFTERAYEANRVFRFEGTPFMETAHKAGRQESIAGHMWSASLYWLNLKSICPALACAVNSERVYEVLLTHDLPEISQGDISMFQQLAGNGVDKKAEERRNLAKLSEPLPRETQQAWLRNFDQFEAEDITQVTDLAILVAKMIDTIQGSFYALTFGDDPVGHAHTHNRIINKHLGGTVRQLIKELDKMGHLAASDEVRKVMRHYITLWQQKGVNLQLDPF